MRWRTLLRLVATAPVAGFAGCSSDDGSTVEMTLDLRVVPETLRVSTGTTAEWLNAGSVGHTVTAYGDQIPENGTYFASGGFDSEDRARSDLAGGVIEEGVSYGHTFESVGEVGTSASPTRGRG